MMKYCTNCLDQAQDQKFLLIKTVCVLPVNNKKKISEADYVYKEKFSERILKKV